jgi:hypothetical protein
VIDAVFSPTSGTKGGINGRRRPALSVIDAVFSPTSGTKGGINGAGINGAGINRAGINGCRPPPTTAARRRSPVGNLLAAPSPAGAAQLR